jgi:hypothetical protein
LSVLFQEGEEIIMKRGRIAVIALTGLLAACGTTVFAQVHHEIALTRAEIQTERQAIVADNLPLTEEQSKAFWPVYRQYRAELAKLGDRFVALIEGYAKNYDTLTDPQAQEMIKEFLAIQKEEVGIKTSWVPKLGKVLPPKALARFYQIENKLDTIVRYQIADEIPLVEHAPQGK